MQSLSFFALLAVNEYILNRGERRMLTSRIEAYKRALELSGDGKAISKGSKLKDPFFSQLFDEQIKQHLHGVVFTGPSITPDFQLGLGKGRELLSLHQFQHVITSFPALKFVIVDGCAHPVIVEVLLSQGIPAVIVTPPSTHIKLVNSLGHRFAQQVGRKLSLESCWEQLKDELPHHPVWLEKNLRFQGASKPLGTTTVEPGLYIPVSKEEQLAWKMGTPSAVMPANTRPLYAADWDAQAQEGLGT
ncbi:MAG: hypothetical protein AAGI38_17790 [Bacteroidota bacterium]